MTWVQSLGWEDPLEYEMATQSGIVPGKSHEQRSLVGYPWGCKRLEHDLVTELQQQMPWWALLPSYGRNINNLRYTDDTTLMAETKRN